MKLMDCHAHIYPENIARKASQSVCDYYDIKSDIVGTPGNLLNVGKKCGISKFLVHSVAVIPKHVHSINDFIGEEIKKHSEFIGFGTLHAEMENPYEEIKRIKEKGLMGIKLHPDTQNFAIDDERMFPIYEELQGKMPFLIHCGDRKSDLSHPRRLRKIIEMFPKLTVIGAHLGGWSRWEEAQENLRDKDCFVDASSCMMFLPLEKVTEYIRGFGSERVLYGTDFPLWSIESEVENFWKLKLTQSEFENIAYKNAENLFGITV